MHAESFKFLSTCIHSASRLRAAFFFKYKHNRNHLETLS